MRYWLLKTEPDTYAWRDLMAAGAAGDIWDGVRNHQAASFLRQMRRGDRAFVYHTGGERRVIGVAEITGEAAPDPGDPSGRFVAVTVRAFEPLARAVGLAEIKAEPALADCLLARRPRLSVMPLTAAQWRVVERLSRRREE